MEAPMSMTFKNRDEFQREGIARKLLNLLESDAPASPVLLDGPWGSGKSEFCHKFINLSIQENSPLRCLYVDAYKFDHSDDPLLMLIAGISSLVQDASEKTDLLKKAIPVARVLGKVVGKAAVAWTLKTSADRIGDELSEAITSGSEELIDQSIEKAFHDFEKIEENLSVYRSALAKAAKKEKILIIVDELDRCRPVFALSLLEKVKHIFGVEGIKFLFCTNLTQLCAIVKKQYGPDIDGDTYLGKFFNFTVRLPIEHTKHDYAHAKNSSALFGQLIANSEFKGICESDSPVLSFIESLIERENRSLRDVETFHRNLMIYNSIAKERAISSHTAWLRVALIILAIYIYTFKPQLTSKLLSNTWTLADVSALLEKKTEALHILSPEVEKLIYAIFVLDLDPPVDPSLLDDAKAKAWNQEIYRCFSHGRDPSQGHRVALIQLTIRRMQLL